MVDLTTLIRILADTWLVDHVNQPMDRLHVQAQALTEPFLDYETPARNAGWLPSPHEAGVYQRPATRESLGTLTYAHSWTQACEIDELEPEVRGSPNQFVEVQYLYGRQLQDRGERVDFDFADMIVWARYVP